MGAIVIGEQTTGPAAEAAKGKIWVKDDTPNVVMFTDDAGTEWTLSLTISRATSLGAAPSAATFKWLDQTAGFPDILYASMKKSDDTWDWVEVTRAP